jgi:hypothetical protein
MAAAFGDGVSSHNGLLVVGPNGAVQVVARLGAAAPGGGTFAPFFLKIGLNDAREVAFRAKLESTLGGVWGQDGRDERDCPFRYANEAQEPSRSARLRRISAWRARVSG